MPQNRSQAQALDLARKYDLAAPAWGDKMRTLGYFDAYLGFLADPGLRAAPGHRAIDIGAGSAAMAEAWVAIQGPDLDLTLLDPAPRMLAAGTARLHRRGVVPSLAETDLRHYRPQGLFQHLLAAHVIEHAADPGDMLGQMRALAAPGARLWLVVSKPHWCNAIVWLQWRHRSFSPPEMRALLPRSGWRLASEYTFPAGPPSRTSRGYLCIAA